MFEFSVTSEEFRTGLQRYRFRMVDLPFLLAGVFIAILCAATLSFERSRTGGLIIAGILVAHLMYWRQSRNQVIARSTREFDDVGGGMAAYRIDADGIATITASDKVQSNWSAFIEVKYWDGTWAVFRAGGSALLFPAERVPRELADLLLASVVPLNRRDPRCKTCNYSLRGLRDAHCPECGAPFVRDGSLVQARPVDSTHGPIE